VFCLCIKESSKNRVFYKKAYRELNRQREETSLPEAERKTHIQHGRALEGDDKSQGDQHRGARTGQRAELGWLED
jgi:hypothetical protein